MKMKLTAILLAMAMLLALAACGGTASSEAVHIAGEILDAYLNN